MGMINKTQVTKKMSRYVENIHEIYCSKKQFYNHLLDIQQKKINKFSLKFNNFWCKISLNEIVYFLKYKELLNKLDNIDPFNNLDLLLDES